MKKRILTIILTLLLSSVVSAKTISVEISHKTLAPGCSVIVGTYETGETRYFCNTSNQNNGIYSASQSNAFQACCGSGERFVTTPKRNVIPTFKTNLSRTDKLAPAALSPAVRQVPANSAPAVAPLTRGN